MEYTDIERESIIQQLLGRYKYPRSFYSKKSTKQLVAMLCRAQAKATENKPAVNTSTYVEADERKAQVIDHGSYYLVAADDPSKGYNKVYKED